MGSEKCIEIIADRALQALVKNLELILSAKELSDLHTLKDKKKTKQLLTVA